MEQHRGTLVLVLGILSLVVCQLLGPVAWLMANKDLAEMAAGRMDREGEGMTTAGKICGIIATVIVILLVVGIVLSVVLFGGLAALGIGLQEVTPQ